MRAPRGRELKRWLLGGGEIETSVALFPWTITTATFSRICSASGRFSLTPNSSGNIRTPPLKRKKEKLDASGWTKVTVLPRGEFFSKWEYDQTSKKQGGEVFIEVRHSGEVASIKAMRRDGSNRPKRREIKKRAPNVQRPLKTMWTLHRHAAGRAMLLKHQGVALRLLAAHLMVGAPNITMQPDPQRTRKEETAASVAASKGQIAFEKERADIGKLLDLEEPSFITGGNEDGWRLASIFARLMKLSDADIARILTFVTAEIIAVGHEAVDCLARVFHRYRRLDDAR